MRPVSLQFLRYMLGIALLLQALFLPALESRAQAAPANEPSVQVSAGLDKLRDLTDAKKYAEGVRFLDTLIPAAPADSFDFALLSQIKGQVLLADARYDAAIGPLEAGLLIGDRHGYFDRDTVLTTLYALSQLYYRQGTETKDPARQKQCLGQAGEYIERWLRESPRPSVENQLFSASILYSLATLDPAHVDLEKVRQSLAAAEKSLRLNLTVSTQTYVLMLAALQQLGETRRAADILELLVQREPDSSLYWQQLLAAYYSLAGATKNQGDIRRYTLRALITFERAQSRGLLNTPRDNFSVVALYFNLGQFDRAAGLLARGLRDGSIEGTRRNWELLASAYQQQHDDARSLEVLREAVRVFPQDGQFEFALARSAYAQGKLAEAYARLEAAVAKGNLDKPGQALVFLAGVAYELKRFDDASRWVEAAADKPDVKKEDLTRLAHAIKEAVAARAALKTPQL